LNRNTAIQHYISKIWPG